jgi:hypothetical protein
MNYHHEMLRYLPAQATAAGFVPVILLAFNKLAMRQTVHKQRDLREKVIALNGFIGNMDQFPDVSEHHAICLQDAVRQRGLLLMLLASLSPPEKPAVLLYYVRQRCGSTSPFVCAIWSVRAGAALDLLFLSDRGIHWPDSSPFSYRLSATDYSRSNCDWGFRYCDSCAAGVVLCRSAQARGTSASCEYRVNTSAVQRVCGTELVF